NGGTRGACTIVRRLSQPAGRSLCPHWQERAPARRRRALRAAWFARRGAVAAVVAGVNARRQDSNCSSCLTTRATGSKTSVQQLEHQPKRARALGLPAPMAGFFNGGFKMKADLLAFGAQKSLSTPFAM